MMDNLIIIDDLLHVEMVVKGSKSDPRGGGQ